MKQTTTYELYDVQFEFCIDTDDNVSSLRILRHKAPDIVLKHKEAIALQNIIGAFVDQQYRNQHPVPEVDYSLPRLR